MDRSKILPIICAGTPAQPPCAHYRAEPGMRTLDKCTCPALAKKRDLVRGDELTTFCDSAREGKCGTVATHYAPLGGGSWPRYDSEINFPPA